MSANEFHLLHTFYRTDRLSNANIIKRISRRCQASYYRSKSVITAKKKDLGWISFYLKTFSHGRKVESIYMASGVTVIGLKLACGTRSTPVKVKASQLITAAYGYKELVLTLGSHFVV